MGHTFNTISNNSNFLRTLDSEKPDLLITSLSRLHSRDDIFDKLISYRKTNKIFVAVSIPLWRSPLAKYRINEDSSLSENHQFLDYIKRGLGDFFYNVCESEDYRMDGFEKGTGYRHHALPLAADKTLMNPEYDKGFASDISYIGTNLPEKRDFFKKNILPYKKQYRLKLYGQDWTVGDKALGWIQRAGQYFNIEQLKRVQKPKLQLADEPKIYLATTVNVNVHENYQRKYGGDCNERTFKIPAYGGFELTDNVACINKYFIPNTEIVIGESDDDWKQKLEFYLTNPEKRIPIIEAGKRRVLKDHTYHNRVEYILNYYKKAFS